MSSIFQNMIVLTLCWFIAIGGGVYTTFFVQPAELERLEKAEQVARMKQAEMASLVAEMSESEFAANDIVTRWNSRYKVIPQTLATEDVIRFLNDLTNDGFNPFDVSFDGMQESSDYNEFSFDIEGRGGFNEVYNLVWSIENDQQLYRIEELELNHFDLITSDPDTGKQRLEVMVSFSFTLHAYFGGAVGLSAGDSEDGAPGASFFSDNDLKAELPEVPLHVLPSRTAGMNPFEPLIMQNIPPNTHGLIDIEEAELLYIVGTDAVLEWDEDEYVVGIGDPVYLGQVISVDPRRGTLVARLNKGGIVDQVELSMDLDELYKQARGSVRLSPSKQ